MHRAPEWQRRNSGPRVPDADSVKVQRPSLAADPHTPGESMEQRSMPAWKTLGPGPLCVGSGLTPEGIPGSFTTRERVRKRMCLHWARWPPSGRGSMLLHFVLPLLFLLSFFFIFLGSFCTSVNVVSHFRTGSFPSLSPVRICCLFYNAKVESIFKKIFLNARLLTQKNQSKVPEQVNGAVLSSLG